jgi:hypothetical protein
MSTLSGLLFKFDAVGNGYLRTEETGWERTGVSLEGMKFQTVEFLSPEK